ncbi:MAG: hypothetical protein AAF098_00410 [Pseudomonadota bacterium]
MARILSDRSFPLSIKLPLLALLFSVLLGCTGSESGSQRVAQWVEEERQKIPDTHGSLSRTALELYENQVIETFSTANPTLDPEDSEAVFAAVSTAVCQLEKVNTLWETGHEHYSTVNFSGGRPSMTIQTKAFDCCVLEKQQFMSKQEAQNACPY